MDLLGAGQCVWGQGDAVFESSELLQPGFSPAIGFLWMCRGWGIVASAEWEELGRDKVLC